jgi:hypothetical protein
MKLFLIPLFSLFITFTLHAETIANIDIPNAVYRSDQSSKLILNGAGIRTKFVFDIYVGSLYLEKKLTSAKDIFTDPGEKRISMHFLYKEVTKEKLVDGWNDGFKNNHTSGELEKLNARITQFNNLFVTVKKGDVINLNFTPASGTQVIINGESKGRIAGSDFFTAVLKIWLGEEPADSELKEAMLGNKV